MARVDQVLFIETAMNDVVLTEMKKYHEAFAQNADLKIYFGGKRRHRSRKKLFAVDDIQVLSYLLWNRQSLRDGWLTVRSCYSGYSKRMPIRNAIVANNDVVCGHIALENVHAPFSHMPDPKEGPLLHLG